MVGKSKITLAIVLFSCTHKLKPLKIGQNLLMCLSGGRGKEGRGRGDKTCESNHGCKLVGRQENRPTEVPISPLLGKLMPSLELS